jgi:Bacterial archaeo-eukaryotic release factor family 10
MMTQEELRQLAEIDSPSGCAVSFYFQPRTPRDKSHREEAILAKDLVRDALRQAERAGNHQLLRADLERVLALAESLYGNHSLGKAVFACGELGIWIEMDLPPRLGRSQIKVDTRFHLRPLVAAQAGAVRTCIALVNRLKARVFEMNTGATGDIRSTSTLAQRPDLEFGPLPKTGRSDGYLGYEAGHRERHAENQIKNHYKLCADSLQSLLNRDKFDAILIGCHDEAWPEIETVLSTALRQRLLGRFLVDPIAATAPEIREQAGRILEQTRSSRLQSVVREAIGEAYRKARGAVGLRHVLTALERQEVQTLILGGNFKAEGGECTNCRHIDTRKAPRCAICGSATREVGDLTDAMVDLALRNGAAIEFIDSDPDLEKVGHVAALLRFRAEQSAAERLAV